MKKSFKLLFFLLALAMIAVYATACTGSNSFPVDKEAEAVCILFGKQEHFPVVNAERFYKDIVNVCYNYGSVSFALMQSNPSVGDSITVAPPSMTVDREKRTQLARRSADQILEAIESATPEREEVDVLASIQLGSDLLKCKTEPVRNLVIVSNMLSTSGLMNFTTGELIEQDVEYVVSQLNAVHAIPDLSFVDSITIYGFAQTCGSEQDELTADYKHKLKLLWLGIFEAGGCSEDKVLFDTTPLEDIEPQGYPHVATVPVDEVTFPYLTEAPVTEGAPQLTEEPPISTPINLLEDVHFKEDSAELVDYNDAIRKLSDVAAIILEHPESTFLLLGGCAGDISTTDDTWGMRLSRDRAACIRSLLISSFGVPPHQLLAYGMGSLCVFHFDGLGTGSDGSVNRVVYIVNSDTSIGRDVMASWQPTD